MFSINLSIVIHDQPFAASVTSVGSTTGIKQEQAASFSSGGFSNIFPRPSYQEKAVFNYLDSLGDTYSGRFNASGRAFPDVSALGIGLQIVANGSIEAIGGTSASSPIWASIVGLLNDELIGKGMPVVGFLNPLIYEHPEALKDITLGECYVCCHRCRAWRLNGLVLDSYLR